jgi:hypothetical protein
MLEEVDSRLDVLTHSRGKSESQIVDGRRVDCWGTRHLRWSGEEQEAVAFPDTVTRERLRGGR